MGAEQKETVKCEDPLVSVGRKVRIEVLNYLTLCEVKVFTKTEMEIGKTDRRLKFIYPIISAFLIEIPTAGACHLV